MGELLWDLLPEGKQLGGAPANFAYHSACLGAEAYVISAIGKDQSGEEIISKFNCKKLPVDYISIQPEYPTGTVDVVLNEAGNPQYVIHQNVAWDHIPFSPQQEQLVQKADAICFGSLAQRNSESRNTLYQVLSHTKDSCLKIFDCNLRYPFFTTEIIIQSLSEANVLKLNEDEFSIFAGIFDTKQDQTISLLFEKFNLQLIAVTYGAEGSRLFTKKEESFLGSTAIKVADTIGAGDAFTAAMVSGLLENIPLHQVHERAVQLSSFVCTQNGAMPDYQSSAVLL